MRTIPICESYPQFRNKPSITHYTIFQESYNQIAPPYRIKTCTVVVRHFAFGLNLPNFTALYFDKTIVEHIRSERFLWKISKDIGITWDTKIDEIYFSNEYFDLEKVVQNLSNIFPSYIFLERVKVRKCTCFFENMSNPEKLTPTFFRKSIKEMLDEPLQEILDNFNKDP